MTKKEFIKLQGEVLRDNKGALSDLFSCFDTVENLIDSIADELDFIEYKKRDCGGIETFEEYFKIVYMFRLYKVEFYDGFLYLFLNSFDFKDCAEQLLKENNLYKEIFKKRLTI